MRTFRVAVLAAMLLSLSLALPAAAADASAIGDPVRIEDDDLRLRFGGTWAHSWAVSSSGHSTRISRTAGSWVSASFDGTGCALVARTGPTRGKASLYVDGAVVDTLDLYTPTISAPVSVWATSTLSPGTHTVKIVVLGTKSPESTDKWVVVDAIDVWGSPGTPAAPGSVANNGNSNLLKLGAWRTSARPAAFGGSSLRITAGGATVSMRFRGSSVAWISRKDYSSGKAEVLLDGKRVATVGLYSPTTQERRVAWSKSGLPYGEHTVTIRALGTRAVSEGGAVTDFDAFAHNGTLLKAYRPTPFKYPWKTYIVIDKSSFRLYWVKNGYLIKTYPIAHGRPSAPTPVRTWRINSKYRTAPSSVYGPRKMRLYKQVRTASGYRYEYTRYLVHGTNQPWVIGTRASAGCIRMYNRDVLELWPQVPLGTMVVTRD